MNEKERQYQIKNGNYFILVSIILFILVLVMAMINLNYYIRKSKEKPYIEIKNHLYGIEKEYQAVINPSCLILTGGDKNDSIKIIEGSLEKARIDYITKVMFEDITDNELQSADIIIINGNKLDIIGNVDSLFNYLKKGKHIIFTNIPDVDYIRTSELKKIMGIKNLTESQLHKGVKFLPGFMLGGLLEFPKLSFVVPKAELLSTTKTYVTDLDGSSMIWRNIYNGSHIFVVNGSFIETNAGYGVMSAILAQIYSDYIYPVVNAKVLTYTRLPYLNYENNSILMKIYNRNAMQLQQDILIPDILSINKSRKLIPSGFVYFNKAEYINGLNNYNKRHLNSYKKDIYRLGGEVGMVYSGDLEKDLDLYHQFFNGENFESILLNEKNLEDIIELTNDEEFNIINSVIGPWIVDEKSFGFINKNVVYIPFTIEGIANTDLEKLEFYSGVTAFGAIIQNFDFEQIIYPIEEKDHWINVWREHVKYIDSYREKFEMIESKNITETAHSVKKFVVNDPLIKHSNNKIEIIFDQWYGESSYILRTNKDVESIIGGTITIIEDGAYLVIAKNKKIEIILREIGRYGR